MRDNPNFDRWFANSQVVDDAGVPLMVYHGTRNDFDSFDLSRAGEVGDRFAEAAFFTDNPRVAAAYAAPWTGNDEFNAARQAEDVALHAWGKAVVTHGRHSVQDQEAEREKEARANERRRVAEEVEAMRKPSTGANVLAVHLSLQNPLVIDAQGSYYFKVHRQAFEKALEGGHDGLIVRNVIDSASVATQYPATVFVAFKPQQVKSAIANSGAYDPEDPDITDRRALAAEDALAWLQQTKKVALRA